MKRLVLKLLVGGLIVLLAACAGKKGDTRKLDERLLSYQSTIRWGQLAAAVEVLDPEQREKLAPTPLQLRRMEQLQVTAYRVRGKQWTDATEVRQVVEIQVVNRHTQVERTVIDRQVWRWDGEEKTWWLTTPLPDFEPK
ncbi:MAG: hypothetical protein KDJ14_06695 [Xanthomonadales bacterium]|nr:hypothetical protein [Xanthomonadales bacterium]